jgi:prophage regulatory protein
VRAVKDAGGLIGRAELAAHWGVSRQRIAQLVALEDFPAPIGFGNGGPVWLVSDVDAWRAARPGPGRPRANAGHGGDPR